MLDGDNNNEPQANLKKWFEAWGWQKGKWNFSPKN